MEPDEGFVATEYKKEIQVTKKKIIPTILIYDNITLYLIEYKNEIQVTKKKIIPTILIYNNIKLYLIEYKKEIQVTKREIPVAKNDI